MAELSPFDLKKLDQTKRTAVAAEQAYYQLRFNDGIRLRTRYRNNGNPSQWGTGGDHTGTAHRKKGGPKSKNHMVMVITSTGRKTFRRMTEAELAAQP